MKKWWRRWMCHGSFKCCQYVNVYVDLPPYRAGVADRDNLPAVEQPPKR